MEKPILFSAPMIRAILAGTKTQTRRIVRTKAPLEFIGGRGEEADPDKWGWFFDGPDQHGYMVLGRGHDERFDHGSISIPCPYDAPRLWVRETHRHYGNHCTGNGPVHAAVQYRADDATMERGEWPDFDAALKRKWWNTGREPWTPGIHMPRWASRITLDVTGVRVERLQDISEEDAKAEGLVRCDCSARPGGGQWITDGTPAGEHQAVATARDAYAILWDTINGKRAPWESNPWVFVIEFHRAVG